MSKEYSYTHQQPDYWEIRFDAFNGTEAAHIHAKQGDRELQVITSTLRLKHQDGEFSKEEIKEIVKIASKYPKK